jgi:hypothetical protein
MAHLSVFGGELSTKSSDGVLPEAHLIFYAAGMPHRIQCGALPISLSPQREEGMRVRGGYAQGSARTKRMVIPTPHP